MRQFKFDNKDIKAFEILGIVSRYEMDENT